VPGLENINPQHRNLERRMTARKYLLIEDVKMCSFSYHKSKK